MSTLRAIDNVYSESGQNPWLVSKISEEDCLSSPRLNLQQHCRIDSIDQLVQEKDASGRSLHSS